MKLEHRSKFIAIIGILEDIATQEEIEKSLKEREDTTTEFVDYSNYVVKTDEETESGNEDDKQEEIEETEKLEEVSENESDNQSEESNDGDES
jgi:hypothetical protein